jgi:serine protease Do
MALNESRKSTIKHTLCSCKVKNTGYFFTLFTILVFTASPVMSKAAELQEQLIPSVSSEVIKKATDDAIAEVKPALVRIFSVSVKYQNGREVKYESSGSGVIITKEGHIITNHHVVGNAKRIICTLSDKKETEADLIGTDPLTDISVIKLRSKGKEEYPYAIFGDSSLLKVGDYILAMGSPYALSQSVTMGIVSNTEIIIPKFLWPLNKITIDGEDVGSIVKWIGHDAPIYGGNSGGPLVNLKGEIVGINEINLGISGAIPGNLAKEVAEKLIRFGRVSRSWIGLEVQPLFKHSEHEKGVIVSGTIEGSPADKSGFLSGDILLSLDGKEINIRFQEEIPLFNQLVMEIPLGKEIGAVVHRQGKEITLHLTTQEREYIRPKSKELKAWGITARNLSLLNAKEMNRENKDGVLVTSARVGGPCWEAKPNISGNDVIVEIDGKKIKDLEELMEITDRIIKERKEPFQIIVTFERKKERLFSVVKLNTEKEIRQQGIEVQKAWLPAAMQAITKDIARELGIAEITGMRITQIYPDRSAERAGLKAGDIIIGLNGEPIHVLSPEDSETLPAMIRQYKTGSTVELTIVRDKERIKITVTLEQSPPMPGEMNKYTDSNFEFTVRDIAFIDRAQEGWRDDQKGVLVEAVNEGGWASISRLAVGDLIQTVDDRPISDVPSFEQRMKDIANRKPKGVLFQVRRGIHIFYVELEPAW